LLGLDPVPGGDARLRRLGGLQRGKKLTRTQLDAKAKNSFWHAAAITFCDTSKTFDLIDFPLLGGLSRGYIG